MRPEPRRGDCARPIAAPQPAHAVLNTAVWLGDAAPPLNPRQPAPLPEQRMGAGGRLPNPGSGWPYGLSVAPVRSPACGANGGGGAP